MGSISDLVEHKKREANFFDQICFRLFLLCLLDNLNQFFSDNFIVSLNELKFYHISGLCDGGLSYLI